MSVASILTLLYCLALLFTPLATVFMLDEQFTFIASDKKAINCTVSTFVAKTRLFCMKYCLINKECHGINYQSSTGMCELLSKNMDLDSLSDEKGFDLYHRKIGCEDFPCKHGLCISEHMTVSNYRAYTCQCNCGWCGRDCDILSFNIIENGCIENYNAGYKKVNNIRECMVFCADVFHCSSADYFLDTNECWLNSVSKEIIPITENCSEIYGMNIWYLSPNCSCSDSIN